MRHHKYSLHNVEWTGWPVEDAKVIRGNPKRESAGFLYVVEFTDGWIKVGRTRNAKVRINDYAKEAYMRRAKVVRVHLSGPHEGYEANEATLINFCAGRAQDAIGREYFHGLRFEAVSRFVDGLPQRLATDEEVAERKRQAHECRERLRRHGLSGEKTDEEIGRLIAEDLHDSIARFLGRRPDGSYPTIPRNIDMSDPDYPQNLLEQVDEIAEWRGVPIQQILDMSWIDFHASAIHAMVRTQVAHFKAYASSIGCDHMTEPIGEYIFSLLDERNAIWATEAEANATVAVVPVDPKVIRP
ncbi:hypothetical protein [Nonomuraea wenchangensis]|uniref:hypothetical protein n=1 Tax=Nonomuraea wenchangensis TaxID=568860 RepID=UPI00331B46C9